MTHSIEPHIKKYIDATVGIATEEFQHRFTLLTEIWEGRTRAIVREEIDEKINPFLRRMDVWETEMKELRKDVNIHHKRINKLEHAHD